jgi:hypothetical protein
MMIEWVNRLILENFVMTIRESILSDIRNLYGNESFTVTDLMHDLGWHDLSNLSAHLCTMRDRGELDHIDTESNYIGAPRNVYRLPTPKPRRPERKVNLSLITTDALLTELRSRCLI